MISLINASAFRSENDEDPSKNLTAEDCENFLAQYNGSKIRLWKYNSSLSRLEVKVETVPNERLLPIDLVFVTLSDVRSPVHWTLGEFKIRDDPESARTRFEVPSAGVSFTASSLTIVVQNLHPNWHWELKDRGRNLA